MVSKLGVWVGILALLATGALGASHLRSEHEVAHALREVRARLDEFRERFQEESQRVGRIEWEQTRIVGELAQLHGRGQGLPTGSAGTVSAAAVEEDLEGSSLWEDQVAPEVAEEFRQLLAKVFGRDVAADPTPEEERRFWELARTTGALNHLMGDLEQAVLKAPHDIETRLDLARAYVAKLLTVPDGPERGIWAAKAEEQWHEVIEEQPDQWEANFNIAFSYTQYPDFLNKTPDAIRGFETLKEIQEQASPEDRHVETYLQLSRLYLKQGNADKARQAVQAGIDRHPENSQLQQTRETMGNSTHSSTGSQGNDG